MSIPECGTIFYEGTPLHDGAVVIRDGRIVAAGCVLPLSNNLEMGKDMGTRHRAGLGMSENSDAIVVVVSEETGIISLAKNGVLIRRLDRQNLFNLLQEEIIPPETAEAQKQPLLNRLLNKGGAGKQCKNKRSPLNRCAKRMVPFGITAFPGNCFRAGRSAGLDGGFYLSGSAGFLCHQRCQRELWLPIYHYTSKGLDIVDQQAVDNVQVQADGNGT